MVLFFIIIFKVQERRPLLQRLGQYVPMPIALTDHLTMSHGLKDLKEHTRAIRSILRPDDDTALLMILFTCSS